MLGARSQSLPLRLNVKSATRPDAAMDAWGGWELWEICTQFDFARVPVGQQPWKLFNTGSE